MCRADKSAAVQCTALASCISPAQYRVFQPSPRCSAFSRCWVCSQPTGEGLLGAADVQVAGWMRQTWELTVRNFRRELCMPYHNRMPVVCCTALRQAGNEPQHPTYATQPANPGPAWARTAPAMPCREYNRNLLYSVIRGAIMLAVAVVFATLFIGQGSRYDTFAGERDTLRPARPGSWACWTEGVAGLGRHLHTAEELPPTFNALPPSVLTQLAAPLLAARRRAEHCGRDVQLLHVLRAHGLLPGAECGMTRVFRCLLPSPPLGA